METKKQIKKQTLSSVRCGNCGSKIDSDTIKTMPDTDTAICLCRYCGQ